MGFVFRCSAIVRGKLFGFLFGGCLDAVQVVAPEALEILNPVVHGFELLRVQPIQPALPGLVNGNHAHFPQHPQVFGNRRLGKAEPEHQFRNIVLRPQGQQIHNFAPPGFGDSARLARRLAQQSNPVGWFLSQVWDRFRDRAFFLSQRLVRNVREQADVVLYLVNAAEAPEQAGYLAPELAILEWIGKPVIVVINQTGRPRPRDEEHGSCDQPNDPHLRASAERALASAGRRP